EFYSVRGRSGVHLRLGIGVGLARKRRLVHIGAVRLIEQIVRCQEIVALEDFALSLVGPSFMPWIADDLVVVGFLGIPHEDPDEVVAFLDGKAAHLCALWNHRLARNIDALAAAVEHQPVVFAADVVVEDVTVRQRHSAMATAIFERDNAAVLATVENDWLV